MSVNSQKIMARINFQKNKKLFTVLGVVLLLTILANIFIGSNVKNITQPDQVLTIPAMGNLRPLNVMMAENKDIRNKIKQVLSYDEVYLFVNYRQVNGVVAEILFLWSGLELKQLQKMKSREAIDHFLRFVYGFPEDEPIKNNPLLGKRPWPTLFNRFKSKILMQGQGYKIYDGLAYYDSQQDQMVIEGQLSEPFMTGFTKFVKTQKLADQKRFVNNLLTFIDRTKDLKNLSDEEMQMLKNLKI